MVRLVCICHNWGQHLPWHIPFGLMSLQAKRGCIVLLQMGGAEGVRKAERYALVNGIAGGLRMHAISRQKSAQEE